MTTMFSRRTVVALSAYLRRLELSVDRSLREDAAPLRIYCEQEIQPALSAVAGWLTSIGGSGSATPALDRKRRGGPSTVSGRLQLLLRNRIRFDAAEVGLIAATLQQLSAALNQATVVEPGVFAPIRLRLREDSDALLRYVPDARTRRRIERVEHRNQNPVLATEAFESLAGGPGWLTPQRGKIV